MSRRRRAEPANAQHAVPDASPVTFRFANLGPVKAASLRPGRLTVVAGRNNTGKTYIAHLLFGFLKAWRQWPGALEVILEHPRVFPDIVAAAESLLERGRAVIPLGDAAILEQRQLLARELGQTFSEQNTPVIMGSRGKRFQGATLSLAVDDRASSQALSNARIGFGATTLAVGRVGDKAVISIDEAEGDPSPMDLPGWTATAYCFFLLHDLLPRPVILTADRVGISLFAEDLDFMKDRLVDLLAERVHNPAAPPSRPFLVVDDIPGRYALPILENIDSTRGMSTLPRSGGLFGGGGGVVDDIKQMMGGYFSHARDPIRFISQKRGKSFNVPLRLASSSARGMSDLYFFARYASAGSEFLIIDTPESHLDTENQVRLAHVLAGLVREGLHLLVTTHSPWLIKELNNLIMLHGDSLKKLDLARSLGYGPRDRLDPRVVRAYVAENGGLTPARIDDFGIGMPFLDATAQRVARSADLLGDLVREEARERGGER